MTSRRSMRKRSLPDPLDSIFAEESDSLASALFRGYISHSLLFFRQNNLHSFEDLLKDGRSLRLGQGGRTSRSQSFSVAGPAWTLAVNALWQNDERRAFLAL